MKLKDLNEIKFLERYSMIMTTKNGYEYRKWSISEFKYSKAAEELMEWELRYWDKATFNKDDILVLNFYLNKNGENERKK